jgi:DTW domain-containing protein YfiP
MDLMVSLGWLRAFGLLRGSMLRRCWQCLYTRVLLCDIYNGVHVCDLLILEIIDS